MTTRHLYSVLHKTCVVGVEQRPVFLKNNELTSKKGFLSSALLGPDRT